MVKVIFAVIISWNVKAINKIRFSLRKHEFVAIGSGCFEKCNIIETGGKLKDRLRIYRKHIGQPEYQQLEAEEHNRICGKGKFKIFSFFKVKENNLRHL